MTSFSYSQTRTWPPHLLHVELPKTHASASPPKALGPLDRLLSLFRRGTADDAAAPVVLAPTPPATATTDALAAADPSGAALSAAELNRVLARTLAGSHQASVGHVQFIGLERLRDHLGGDWDKEKARVHAAADSVIRGHLLKGDIHRRIDDVSFVVVFASLGRDAARMKCVLIADAIVKRLVGAEVDLSLVLIRTAVLKEDGEVVLQQAADLDGLVGHIAQLPPEDPAAPMDSWLAADPQDRRQRLDWCLRSAKFRFQPLWCVYRGTIFLYRVQPSRRARTGQTLSGYRLLPQPDDPDAVLELDLRCAQAAVPELARARDKGLQHLVGLTAHFESVASVKRRLRLVNVLQRVPEHLRASLVCTIAAVPPGLSQSKLNEIVSGLRPFFRLFTAILRSPDSDLRLFADAKLYAVGVSLPPGQELFDVAGLEIRRLCKESRRLGLKTHLHDLASPSLLRHTLALGFDYIDGDAVAPVVDRPTGILSLAAEDLIA